jgi:hypothetical protein
MPPSELERRDEIAKLKYYATILLNGQVLLQVTIPNPEKRRLRSSVGASGGLSDKCA